MAKDTVHWKRMCCKYLRQDPSDLQPALDSEQNNWLQQSFPQREIFIFETHSRCNHGRITN